MSAPDRGQFVENGQTWLALTAAALPISTAYEWCVQANCGAVVLFSGTIRDHSEGRDGVQFLTYEAYEEQAVPKMKEIAEQLRLRWPSVGRIVLHHRIGRIDVGESSVIVVVSSPHRPDAFEAARFGIDALKSTVPIWKHEVWDAGADWGTGAHDLVRASAVGSKPSDSSPSDSSPTQEDSI